jgi:hypothetical protein
MEITRAELEFLREAVKQKHDSLMEILDFKEEEKLPVPCIPEKTFADHLPKGLLVDPVENGKRIRSTIDKLPKQRKAPYGLKKDGTPAKKRGRKTA